MGRFQVAKLRIFIICISFYVTFFVKKYLQLLYKI